MHCCSGRAWGTASARVRLPSHGQDGLIDELTVMVRPRSAVLALAEAMQAEVLAVQRELGCEALA